MMKCTTRGWSILLQYCVTTGAESSSHTIYDAVIKFPSTRQVAFDLFST